jgi:hypothetical protein
MPADLHDLVAKLDRLSLADQLRVAAGVLDQKRPEVAVAIAQNAVDKIRLGLLLKRKS